MTQALLAVASALVPGLVAWWTGRALARSPDDPALPELLLARQQRLAAVAVIAGLAVVATWAWALPLLLLALMAGSWPLRRTLFEERWSLPRYLVAQLRAFTGWMGPYALLALMPLLVLAVPRWHWPVAIVLGLALLAWLHRYGEAWRWGNRASPLARDDLRPLFETIVARSRVPMPTVYRFGFEGSSLTNAVALPSLREPAVAFSDRLLERMAPAEIGAIFAHEIAHLEYYDARRLRQMRLATWALTVLSVVFPLLVLERIPQLRFLVPWVWPTVVLLALAQRSARAQKHETESDRRAVELTRDPEALVRALSQLHAWARMPRRWAHDFERNASHPSLARRVQAIRAAGASLGTGTDVALPGAPALAPSPAAATVAAEVSSMEPVVLSSTTPGRWVVLDGGRAHWCDGVPAGTEATLATLRDQASTYRALRYADLAELRVAADGDQRVLRAVDRSGHGWSVPLQPHEVARAQQALDQVDVGLGARAPSAPVEQVAGRLVAAGIALAALLAAQFGLVLLPALVALVRPLPAALALAGGMAIGRAAATWGGADAPWLASEERFALLAMSALGIAGIWIAMRRRQQRTTRAGLTALLALVGMAGGPLLAAVAAGAPDWRGGAPEASSLAIALLGVGFAFLVMRGRSYRNSGLLCLALAPLVALLAVGSDRLQGRARAIAWSGASATEVARVQLPVGGTSLRLSPGATRWAVQQFSPQASARYAQRRSWPFVVGDFSGSRRSVEAGDVAFVDDTRLLALTVLAEGTELRLEDAESGSVVRADTLPAMSDPQLWLDRGGGRWSVTGADMEETALVRADGAVGGGDIRVTRLPSEGANIVTLVHRDAVSIAVPRREATMLRGPLLLLAGSVPFRSEMWRLDSTGRRVTAEIAGWPTCAHGTIADEAVCVSAEGRRSALWHLGASGSAERLGTISGFHADGAYAHGRWAGATPGARELMLVEPAARRGRRVALPDSGYVASVQLTRDGAGVLLVHGTSAALVLYRIDEPARAPLARP